MNDPAKVDFSPLLGSADETVADLTDGFQPNLQALTAHGLGSQTGATGRITEAIGLVASGGTVNAAAGSYAEQIAANKQVELLGAGSDSDPASNTVVTGSGAGTGLRITAGGASLGERLVVQGMRFTGYAEGIAVDGDLSHLTFEDVVSTGNSNNGLVFTTAASMTASDVRLTNCSLSGNASIGFSVTYHATLTGLVVDQCHFDGNKTGFYSQAKVTPPSSFSDVTITNSTFNTNTYRGMYVEKLSNATITDCEASNNGVVGTGSWPMGLEVNLKYGNYSNLTFTRVVADNNGLYMPDNSAGIAVKARDDGTDYGAAPATLNGLLIQDCRVSRSAVGIRIGEPGKVNAGPSNALVKSCKRDGLRHGSAAAGPGGRATVRSAVWRANTNSVLANNGRPRCRLATTGGAAKHAGGGRVVRRDGDAERDAVAVLGVTAAPATQDSDGACVGRDGLHGDLVTNSLGQDTRRCWGACRAGSRWPTRRAPTGPWRPVARELVNGQGTARLTGRRPAGRRSGRSRWTARR